MKNRLLEFECSGINAEGIFLLEYTGYGQDVSPEYRDLPMVGIDMLDQNHQRREHIYIDLHCMH